VASCCRRGTLQDRAQWILISNLHHCGSGHTAPGAATRVFKLIGPRGALVSGWNPLAESAATDSARGVGDPRSCAIDDAKFRTLLDIPTPGLAARCCVEGGRGTRRQASARPHRHAIVRDVQADIMLGLWAAYPQESPRYAAS